MLKTIQVRVRTSTPDVLSMVKKLKPLFRGQVLLKKIEPALRGGHSRICKGQTVATVMLQYFENESTIILMLVNAMVQNQFNNTFQTQIMAITKVQYNSKLCYNINEVFTET